MDLEIDGKIKYLKEELAEMLEHEEINLIPINRRINQIFKEELEEKGYRLCQCGHLHKGDSNTCE